MVIPILAVLAGFSLLFRVSSANSTEIDDRIYGGSSAKLGQFPFQARLEILAGGSIYVCGGSLISDQWVLTAAHCTQGASSVRVTVGVIDSKANTGQTRVSKQHYEHPNYNEMAIINDIAVVKLPTKVTLNSKVNIIHLPKKSQAPTGTFEGKSAVISGWGRTNNNQQGSVRYLQYANVKVMNHRSCQRYYYMYTVGSGEICTNNAQTRSGTCQGDSGGPLIYNNNGKKTVIGLTSWGVSQCQSGSPSVYTNVAAYLGFIHSKTGIPIS